jgi:hypothetical protein
VNRAAVSAVAIEGVVVGVISEEESTSAEFKQKSSAQDSLTAGSHIYSQGVVRVDLGHGRWDY